MSLSTHASRRAPLAINLPITLDDALAVRPHSVAHLVAAVQELSQARDLDAVMEVVRTAARQLTGADGATFVLRDGDRCYYADEDAIGPLWKGQRFPMETCISGWAMLHRKPAVIPDIYLDPHIPHDAYRPTFVRSLVMVPIRSADPLGAIGNYWAEAREPSPADVQLLQALANSAAIAVENAYLNRDLERRVAERTAELESARRELEAFSYSVAHDLRGSLRASSSFGRILRDEHGASLDPDGRQCVERILAAAATMTQLTDDLFELSSVNRLPLQRKPVRLSELADLIAVELQDADPARRVTWRVEPSLIADGDPGLLRILLANLLGNAWKYTSRRARATVELGFEDRDGQRCFYVRDDGAGFDMAYASRLFLPFQRLHGASEFPGTGIGLATCHRVVHRHGGRIWAEGAVGQGATFWWTLGVPARAR